MIFSILNLTNRVVGRRDSRDQVATVSEASPTNQKNAMSKKIFQSNETLEMCDVKVNEDGRIEITTKSYHTTELERLGKPEKTIRGRMKMVEKDFVFDPYAEGSRKPTYSKQVVVGSTTLAVTEDKVKVSFLVPRHLSKPLMRIAASKRILAAPIAHEP